MRIEVMRAFEGVVEYYDCYVEGTDHVQSQRRISQLLAQHNKGLVLDVATGTGILEKH